MRIKSILTILVFAVLFTACKAAKYPALEDGLYADVQTNKGDILLKLHAKDVPLTVANFVALAEGSHPKMADSLKGKKFYDGIKFHRVIANFMIQSGDPLGTGAGNAGYRFADEFPTDSIGGLIYKHDGAGVLSMANSGPKTNSSQFFITHKETPWLDRKHSVFGKVEIGQNVVDSIAKNDVINTIDIIRVGSFAKNFNASEVFETELANVEIKEKAYQEKLAKLKEAFLKEKGKDKAVTTASGLGVLELKKGNGKKFNSAVPASMHYTVSLADGKLIQSTDGKDPFTFTLDKQPMIGGVTEALKDMRVGDKKRLFIPYYLGYGEKVYGPFPAKSDIVFDLELVKVGK